MTNESKNLKAWVVSATTKEDGTKGKPFWMPVGLAFRNKRDNGYTIPLANLGHPNQKLVLLDPAEEPPKNEE